MPAWRSRRISCSRRSVAAWCGWRWIRRATPVGFVWLDTRVGGHAIGIAEIDVLPEHGRQGIGAALLDHACDWARAAGYRRVDLGTLADVAWNAPFYAQARLRGGRQGRSGVRLRASEGSRERLPRSPARVHEPAPSALALRRVDGVAGAGQAEPVPAHPRAGVPTAITSCRPCSACSTGVTRSACACVRTSGSCGSVTCRACRRRATWWFGRRVCCARTPGSARARISRWTSASRWAAAWAAAAPTRPRCWWR